MADQAPLKGEARVSRHVDKGLGGDPDAQQGGDEGARAGADVDVEVERAPVQEKVVEAPQHPQLVDPAGDPTAGQDQCSLARSSLRAAYPPTALTLRQLAP